MHAVSIVCAVVLISTEEKPSYWWSVIFLEGRDGTGPGIKARRVYKGNIYIYLGLCVLLKSERKKGIVPESRVWTEK